MFNRLVTLKSSADLGQTRAWPWPTLCVSLTRRQEGRSMSGGVTEGPGLKAKGGAPLVAGVAAIAALALAGAYVGSP